VIPTPPQRFAGCAAPFMHSASTPAHADRRRAQPPEASCTSDTARTGNSWLQTRCDPPFLRRIARSPRCGASPASTPLAA